MMMLFLLRRGSGGGGGGGRGGGNESITKSQYLGQLFIESHRQHMPLAVNSYIHLGVISYF